MKKLKVAVIGVQDAVGINKNEVMQIWKAYEEGRIKLRNDDAIEFVHKPAGIIKYQREGLWDTRSHSFIKPPSGPTT